MEWISCSERLPEHDKKVLVFIRSHYRFGYVNSCNQWFLKFDTYLATGVEPTHWQPLPAPPK